MRTLFKKIVIVSLLTSGAAFLLASCGKAQEDTGGTRRTRVCFVTGTQTKAVSPANEAVVSTLDLLAFRSDNGQLDAYNRVSGSTEVSGELSVGTTVRYYVVANAPEHALDGYLTEADLLSGKAVLGLNGASGLLMRGSGSLSVSEGNPAVPVLLDRYVSKVSVESLELKWYDSFTTPPVFRIGRVALVNVVGHMPWSGTPEAGSMWYNRMNVVTVDDGTPETQNVMDMISRSYGLDVTSSAPVTLSGSLYAFPNPTANAVNSETNPDWSVRNTRVALELLVDGESNWYPVDLPAMLPNRHYVITKMTVLGPGVDSPDKPVTRSEVLLQIQVKSWEDVETPLEFELF